jgi:hypothetical protein
MYSKTEFDDIFECLSFPNWSLNVLTTKDLQFKTVYKILAVKPFKTNFGVCYLLYLHTGDIVKVNSLNDDLKTALNNTAQFKNDKKERIYYNDSYNFIIAFETGRKLKQYKGHDYMPLDYYTADLIA